MTLKRLWDTTEKKMVFAKWPTWHDCQVWTDEEGSKLYIYDMAQWLEYTPTVINDGRIYWPQWKVVDWDDEVGFYDTNEPTELYTWESGDKVSYVFKDWDGTILKEGKVDEWTKPTAPADPTRTGYTFTWWNPEVKKITKKTTYTATYTPLPYTITFVDEDGTTVLDEQTCDYGTMPVYAGETPTKEATAQYTYTFSGWTPELATVTWDATYTATYTATVNQYTATIESDDTDKWTVDVSEVTADYGTAISAEANVLTIGSTTITATAEEWYAFSSWGTLPETLTEDVTITATFVSATIPVTAVDLTYQTDIYETEGSTGNTILSTTPANANDPSTLSVTIQDPTVCSASFYYSEGNGIAIAVTWLSAWETTAEVFCSWVSQGTINMHISAPL